MEKTFLQPRPGGIVLAAGSSSRFGTSNKLLETIDDQPLIRRSVLPYVKSALSTVIVVVGYEASNVSQAIEGLPVQTVHNPRYEMGQSTSLRAGIEALEPTDAPGALIGLGDMPGIEPDLLNQIIQAYESKSDSSIIVPFHQGHRGNPVLFDGRYFDNLKSIQGDKGGRELISKHDVHRVNVNDPSILRDVDRPEDLKNTTD